MKLVFTTIHPAPYFDRLFNWLEIKGIEVEPWYSYGKSSEKNWKTYKPSNIRILSDYSFFYIVHHFAKADIIIMHWGSLTNIMIGLFLKIKKRKFGFYLDYPDPQKTKCKGLNKFIKSHLMKMATYMFPACYSCQDYLHNVYGLEKNKIRVFPYSHSMAPDKIADINDKRFYNLINGGKPRLLIASRFIERKGYAIVYKAFEKLKQLEMLDKFDIKIIGNGEQFEKYKAMFSRLSEYIKFLGWIENDEYEKLICECDIYLHPSLFEPFGIPPLDAMERNKYVIVSDGVKSTDIFIKNKGVRIYPSHEDGVLCDILVDILKNKEHLYDYTIDNAKVCHEKYSMQINLNALI